MLQHQSKSPLPYEPSDPLSAMLRTSGNAPTLLSTGPLSSLCATSTITSFSHPKNFYSNLVSSSCDNAKPLWQTVYKLLHCKSSSSLPSSTPGICLVDSCFLLHRQNIQPSSLSSNPTTSSSHSPSSLLNSTLPCPRPSHSSPLCRCLPRITIRPSKPRPCSVLTHRDSPILIYR